MLRRLRSRSLAALRAEIEPVSAGALGRFLPAWQHVGRGGGSGGALRGIDGVLQAAEQLQGVALPASAWETLVLPSRVRDYSPAWLDELMASGELVWSGGGSLPGGDGWLSIHLPHLAPLSLAEPAALEADAGWTERQEGILSVLAGGGGFFFRQVADATGATDDARLADDLWQLVWAGLVTNDTFAPVRAMLGGTKRSGAARAPRTRAHRGYARPTMPARSGPPSTVGRWSLLPERDLDPTRRGAHLADSLLERYGVVTRGAVQAENVRGGFALMYKVLARMEEAGRVRRGYFVEHLGAAQFGTPATVDRLRTFVRDADAAPALAALVLAATDPANPYGAALPWPGAADDPVVGTPAHRPGRKAGALVALVDGHLAAYLERGGKSALTFTDDSAELAAAATEIAAVVRARLRSLRIERVNGASVFGSPFAEALREAGFVATPQGLRLRI